MIKRMTLNIRFHWTVPFTVHHFESSSQNKANNGLNLLFTDKIKRANHVVRGRQTFSPSPERSEKEEDTFCTQHVFYFVYHVYIYPIDNKTLHV